MVLRGAEWTDEAVDQHRQLLLLGRELGLRVVVS